MSGLAMPKPDEATMRRRAEIVADMRIIVPGEGVVDTVSEMRAFESDGLTAYRQLPLVVVLPETVAQVSRILKYCSDRNTRVVPRGSGTSLSGGALPLEDAVLLVMSRFNRILDAVSPEVGGVLEFYANERLEPNTTLLDALTQMGTQLGRALERERAAIQIAEPVWRS